VDIPAEKIEEIQNHVTPHHEEPIVSTPKSSRSGREKVARTYSNISTNTLEHGKTSSKH
jgi:hypothetical protein